jgi:hypothetical protein
MTNASIKIVRPWPAEQPRPPLTHRTESMKAATADPSDRKRPAKTKAA